MPLRQAKTAARFGLLIILLNLCLPAGTRGADTNRPASRVSPQISIRRLKLKAVNTRPTFTETNFQGTIYQHLVLAEGTNHYELFWKIIGKGWFGPPVQNHVNLTLDTNQVYTFTFSGYHNIVGDEQFDEYELLKIVQRRETLYDIEVCEVHHTKMNLNHPVPDIRTMLNPEPWDKNVDRLYPNRRGWWFMPCCGPIATTYLCKKCRAGYEKWQADHPAKPPAVNLPARETEPSPE